MKAVVMAGGAGSRLRPLTVGRCKPMMPLVNQTVLAHILDLLRWSGITEVVMTLQYMASSIQDYFGDGSALGMDIHYAVEEVPLGTAGSVRNASQYLDEPFLVISGDAVTDFNLQEIIAYHKEKAALATLVLYRVAEPLDYGVIVTDPDGRISRFQEKPSWGEVASDTVNTGIYVLDPAVLERIPPNQPYDWGNQVFPDLLEAGAVMHGFVAPGYWCDIGNFSEYRRATADLLGGHVKLPGKLGRHIGGDIWVGEGVEIAPDAQLFGPIYLGNEVKIKGGVIVRGPSVVRDYSIVDNRAYIDRSIIWRNCYIGEGAELRGAILGRQCSIKAKSALFEGAIIGDDSIVGEGAVIHSNVKIWPSKEVERGALVKNSIIWGAQGRRVLFSRYGVTGIVNFDLSPEFAARLGAAFGSILPRGSIVTINRDQHAGSRMLKRAVISGLPSAGLHVRDLQTVPIPVARFFTRTTEAAGGVHVRISPYDQRVVDIRFMGSDGLNLKKSEERNIERVFFREDFRRAYMEDIGHIEYAPEAIPHYIKHFRERIDEESIRSVGFDIVVDYAYASTSLVLPEIFQHLGVESTPLGARVDPAYISILPEVFEAGRDRLAAIVKTLGSDLGVRLDVGGEKMFLADDLGRRVQDSVAAAAMTDLVLRTNPGGVVAVPVSLSSVFEQIAAHYDGRIVRTPVDPASLMQAAKGDDVVMAADGTGMFIFPDFQPVADAMMAVARLLNYLALHQTPLSAVIDSLPHFGIHSRTVNCPWESKGAVMRQLHEQFRGQNIQIVDGIKIFLDGGAWVLIRPDPDRPVFHVVAEASDPAWARSLIDEYAQKVAGLM